MTTAEDKSKHSTNVINVEDYLSKRMNKFAAVEPPPGYRTAVLAKASPRTYEPSGTIPNVSQAALRQLGLAADDDGTKVGRAFAAPSTVSPASRGRPSPKAGAAEGLLAYKSPVRVRVGTPTSTTRPSPGVSPVRGRALRPRSPDQPPAAPTTAPAAPRGTSPRWAYSPAKAVPSKAVAVEPKSRGPSFGVSSTVLLPNESFARFQRPLPTSETPKHGRGGIPEPALPPDYSSGPDYRSGAGYRSVGNAVKTTDPPRYRTTPVPTRGTGSSLVTSGAPRSSSATSTHARASTLEARGGTGSALRRRISGHALTGDDPRALPPPAGENTRSSSGGEQVVSRLVDVRGGDPRAHGRESGTSTPTSVRSVASRQSGDPMQPTALHGVASEEPESKGKPASSRSGSSGDTYAHKAARRSSLTLASPTAPMSPSASRGRISSGGGVVVRAYDPRLSPTISRRTTTYSHVQSSGYGPSGAYVRARPRSHSGGPTSGAQRIGINAAPRPALPQETVALPPHPPAASLGPRPLYPGLESRLTTQTSPVKVVIRPGSSSPVKPPGMFPRNLDPAQRTPDSSPRVTLRLSMSPHSTGPLDHSRVTAENTTPDPDMDVPFSPDKTAAPHPRTGVAINGGTPPRIITEANAATRAPVTPPRVTPPTPPRTVALLGPRVVGASTTPPRNPASPSWTNPTLVTQTVHDAIDGLSLVERIPGTWAALEPVFRPSAAPPTDELLDAEEEEEDAPTSGRASDAAALSPTHSASAQSVQSDKGSPQLAVVRGDGGSPYSGVHSNGTAASEIIPSRLAAVPATPAGSPAGGAKGTSVLDAPFKPIKPAVKPVDPGLLFHSHRTEPKRGDPNLVRQGEVFLDRYEVVRRLGSGDWSTVWLGFDRVREIFVALKVSKETRSKALHEVNIYNQVNGDIEEEERPDGDYNCIIRMLDYFEGRVSGGLNTVMVFEVLGKDLLSLITYPNGALCYKGISIQRAKRVAKCTLQGLAYMHEVTRVFHCDLKPENILLSSRQEEQLATIREVLQQFLMERSHRSARLTDDELRRYIQVTHGDPNGVKIIDLGASRAIGDTLYSVDMIQTLEYRSPEVVLGFSPVDAAIDVWSLACIIWEMLTGVYLFNPGEDKPRNPVHVGLFIARLGDFPAHMATAPGKHVPFFFDSHGAFRYQKYPHLGFQELTTKHGFSQREADEIVEFLLPMLRYDPKERVPARQHLSHPWLAGV